MKINRTGSAQWKGGLKDGKGAISTQSGALKEYPYGFAARFEGKPGTNPEELLGAAYSNQEIADVTNYVTARFGTKGSSLTEKDVASLRHQSAQ